jgi:hypothetical protein
VQWIDEATDLDCLIVRNHMGALCGYVGLPHEHRLYGLGYGEVDEQVEVHGGLTYAAPCQENGKICHVPEPGRPADVWWFGFDCAHAGDLIPNAGDLIPNMDDFGYGPDTYRDIAYVTAECASLAGQLVKLDAPLHGAT